MVTTQTNSPGVLSAGGILDRIVSAKVRRLEDAKRRTPIERLAPEALAILTSTARHSLSASLSREGVNIIAEIKRRSPSKGVIREDLDPARIAKGCEEGGAVALSILAEEDFFGGSLEHIRAIRKRVALPLLRKDFIFDEYQLYESVVAGADAVLLIVAILGGELLKNLIRLCVELGIDTLVEVHTADEMKRAAEAGASMIGVNNRDLTTFNVDLETSIKLAPLAPEGALLISESGINSGEDIRRLRSVGFHAFLVGEHLMRSQDPGAALKRLIEQTGT